MVKAMVNLLAFMVRLLQNRIHDIFDFWEYVDWYGVIFTQECLFFVGFERSMDSQ